MVESQAPRRCIDSCVTRTLVSHGGPHVVTGGEGTPLQEVLRGQLGLDSVATRCVTGGCGACRVLVDGALVNTCKLRLGDLRDGAVVEAYEDLSDEPAAATAVGAFIAERPTRCTLCVPSVGVTAVYLARRGQAGRRAAIDDALETAACMCTGRGSLRRALLAR